MTFRHIDEVYGNPHSTIQLYSSAQIVEYTEYHCILYHLYRHI